jgi:uncharacterized membrane protein
MNVTVLKFETPAGVLHTLGALRDLKTRHHASPYGVVIVSWPDGWQSPAMKELITLSAGAEGTFWRVIAEAVINGNADRLRTCGFDDEFIRNIHGFLTEGTFALLLITPAGLMDKAATGMMNVAFQNVSATLSNEQEQRLREHSAA